jgi:molybdopterin-guanine dinucleotide biosynthesis protein A
MLTLAIQAGGASSRMGQDKALLPFLGQPLIQRVVDRLTGLADETLVTTNHPEDYHFLGLPLFADPIPKRGALGGLYTALSAATHPLVAVVACDMPFVNPRLLSAQIELLTSTSADLVIPGSPEGLEPFHAVYRRETCLPQVLKALETGHWRVDAWLSQVRMHTLSLEEIQRYDPRRLSFWNINTPAEFQLAQQRAIDFADKL